MYFNTKSGKKLASVIAAVSAFIMIEGAGTSLAVNAASVDTSNSKSVGTSYFFNDFTAVSGARRSSGARASSGSSTSTGIVTASYLNMRSGPSTRYSVIGGFSRGTTITVLTHQNGWYSVKSSGGRTGWVCDDYVKMNNSNNNNGNNNTANNNNTPSGTKKIVITASVLNARSGASTSSAILGTVKRNEVYTYTSVKNGWYQIKIPNGKSAYISGDYVKPFSSYAISGGSSYLWPLQSSKNITSYFGWRNGRNHNGIDIAASSGSQIIAVASGKVITNTYDASGYGYYIVVEQNDGIKAYYGHMKSASPLTVGSNVKAGDVVGMVGSTGNSTGNHLHLEFRKGSTKIDPLNYYPNMK